MRKTLYKDVLLHKTYYVFTSNNDGREFAIVL